MDQQIVAAAVRRESMSFVGTAGEYFRIWIVNVCLTIITLGLYSPWAKVRRLKYLYGATRLAGAGFDYHAAPVAILKGRLLAFGALVIYLGAGYLMPGVDVLIGLVVLGFVPWLIVRSRMFNLGNTSYRNIRFGFAPVFGRAYTVIFGYGTLVGVTFGLLYPYYKYKRSDLIVSNSRFGNLPMKLAVISSEYYVKYLMASLIFFGALIVLGIAAAVTGGFGLSGAAEGDGTPGSSWLWLGVLPVLLILTGFLAFAYLNAATTRLVLGNMTVGEHRVICDWSVGRIVWLQMTNLVAIALTAGLLIPWATVRLRRYYIDHLAIEVHGALDEIIAVQSEAVSALGDEFGEAFDVDLGL